MEQCHHPMALKLTLHSPAGSEPNVYEWPLTPGQERVRNVVAVELVETIRWVCVDFPEMAIDNSILSNYDTKSFQSMSDLVDEYNRAINTIRQLQKVVVRPAERLKHRPSRGLLRHILQQVYNQSVADPEKLNQYVPFSSEVYGETSYDLICQLIDNIKMSERDTFIDLGSGVGQIVLQVAASTSCKMVWGIERSEWPSRFAKNMDFHFRRLMRWWGKLYGEFQLIKGDFLDQRHSEKIYSATVVFVNNFAFSPNLDHQLKERFADLRDGIRIISSKAFCPPNFKISDRNLSDIGTIIHVSQLPFLRGSVSWTGKPVSYYLHVIDRTKLEQYYNQLNNQLLKTSKIKEEANAQLKEVERRKRLTNHVFPSNDSPSSNLLEKVPPAPSYGNIPRTLKVYLDNVRNQMMSVIAQFKNQEHHVAIVRQIEFERDRQMRLKSQAALLDKQISHLAENGKKLRQQQEIVYRNRNLTHFNGDVTGISTVNQELILKEIAVALHQRKKLNRQVSKLLSQASDVIGGIYNDGPTPARNLHQNPARPDLSVTEKSCRENHSEPLAKKILHPNRTLAETKRLALPKAGSTTRVVFEDRLQKLITNILNDKANPANIL